MNMLYAFFKSKDDNMLLTSSCIMLKLFEENKINLENNNLLIIQ